MKIKIDIQDVHETVEAANAEEVLKKVKAEAASRAPFLLRGAIKAMPDLKFAEEAVKHHNRTKQHNDPAPASAQAFLDWSVTRGYVTILEN
jgi:hypothetical protein